MVLGPIETADRTERGLEPPCTCVIDPTCTVLRLKIVDGKRKVRAIDVSHAEQGDNSA